MLLRFKRWLYRNHYAKSVANSLYVYLIFLFHTIVNWMPGMLRVAFFRLLLHRCGKQVFFDHNIYIKLPWLVAIGDSVVLNRGVEIYSDFFSKAMVRIGSGVRLAPNVQIHASGHELESGEYLHHGAEVVIGNNVWVGAGTIILSGVCIGEGSVVAAGSVVTRDIPPYSLAVGVPAVIKKTISCSGDKP
jgi:acetyltransferase-like isoleucine patch superfamily enzyme